MIIERFNIIIDGEELKMVCQSCGNHFKHIIGYGPLCPTPWLRNKILKENIPVCPKCGSKNCRQSGIIKDLRSRIHKK